MSATLVARPASKFQRALKSLNRPGHGTGFGKKAFPKGTFKARTSKRRIFSQFSVFRFGMRRNWRIFFKIKAEGAYCCVLVSRLQSESNPKGQSSCHSEQPYREESAFRLLPSSPAPPPNPRLPDVENIWKSCGMCWLTGFSHALYVCKVSRTVGFALVRVRLD